MKINWKVRFKNPQFIVRLLLAIGLPILGYAGLSAEDITSWGTLFGTLFDAIKNPYVVGIVLVSVYNVVPDPTTAGVSDSKQALRYTYPKKETE